MKKPLKRQPNTTTDGEIACMYGTPWLDHFDPPVGTGKGCEHCDFIVGEDAVIAKTNRACRGEEHG